MTSVRFDCVRSAIWSTKADSAGVKTGWILAILGNPQFLLPFYSTPIGPFSGRRAGNGFDIGQDLPRSAPRARPSFAICVNCRSGPDFVRGKITCQYPSSFSSSSHIPYGSRIAVYEDRGVFLSLSPNRPRKSSTNRGEPSTGSSTRRLISAGRASYSGAGGGISSTPN
jgi:hypothetical protein